MQKNGDSYGGVTTESGLFEYSGAGDGASFIGFYIGAQSLTIQVDTYVISW